MFLRFLLSLVDESEKITQLADFLFSSILKGTVPKVPQAKIPLVLVPCLFQLKICNWCSDVIFQLRHHCLHITAL